MRKLFDSRGTSTLEFVVVLPVLLFVLFSIVEVSRAWLTLNLATAAAREGVRAGVVAAPDSVSTAGNAKINAMLGSGNWTGAASPARRLPVRRTRSCRRRSRCSSRPSSP
jgi:Flp pilus assembly protein TadG